MLFVHREVLFFGFQQSCAVCFNRERVGTDCVFLPNIVGILNAVINCYRLVVGVEQGGVFVAFAFRRPNYVALAVNLVAFDFFCILSRFVH